MIFADTSTQGFQISDTWSRTDCWLHIQLPGAQGGNVSSASLGTRANQVKVATDNTTVVFHINKRGGTIPLPVSSNCGPISVATITRHSSQSQTDSGLSHCDSKPPVQAQPVDNHGMESLSRDLYSDLRVVGISDNGHICHSPQRSNVSDLGATSTGRGGGCTITTLAEMVDVHVSSVYLAEQGYSETSSHSFW